MARQTCAEQTGDRAITAVVPSSKTVTYARRAWWLVTVTLAYNLAEAALAVWLGIRAASIVLVGFGLDSMIEAVAAFAVLPRIKALLRPELEASSERLERRVHRIVGITFLALAAYVTVQSLYVLLGGQAPEESWLGIALSLFSLIVMPLVAWAKLRCADELGSRALRAEAKETLACAYLSLTLFLGLAGNAAFGWWWTDPVAALLMVPWLVREGLEGLRGECQCD